MNKSSLSPRPARAPAGSRAHSPARVPAARQSGSDGLLGLQKKAGNLAVESLLKHGRRAAERPHNEPPPFAVAQQDLLAATGPGQRLPGDLQQELSQLLGADFSGILVHDNLQADFAAKALGAEALAAGNHIAFRAGRYQPETPEGLRLICHEAQHIAARTQPGGSTGTQTVQLRISPEDVSLEMVGQSFTVRKAYGTPPKAIPEGGVVVVTDWGAGSTVRVYYSAMGNRFELDVPKLLLTPQSPGAKGVSRYEVGLPAQQKSVEQVQKKVARQEAVIEDWENQKGKYQKKPKSWEKQRLNMEAELVRLESDLQERERILNRMLIVGTMYNRFDTLIAKWVTYYNESIKPEEPLDPNVVKSILFQESHLGTSGKHLMLPSQADYHPAKSRYNLGQTIDSAGPQQLLMIEEIAPEIYKKYQLENLARQNRKKGMTNQEFDAWNGGDFVKALYEFWQYRGPGGENRMGSSINDLTDDYSFWIRTAVRWLFVKYFSVANPSWPQAVQAYNGRGKKAEEYRKEVMGRASSQKPLLVGM